MFHKGKGTPVFLCPFLACIASVQWAWCHKLRHLSATPIHPCQTHLAPTVFVLSLSLSCSWLLEVNASPSLTASSQEDYELKSHLLEDTLNIVDMEGR